LQGTAGIDIIVKWRRYCGGSKSCGESAGVDFVGVILAVVGSEQPRVQKSGYAVTYDKRYLNRPIAIKTRFRPSGGQYLIHL
jgi:hypothetical protein